MTTLIAIGLVAVLAVAALVLRLRAPQAVGDTTDLRRGQLLASLADLARAHDESLLDGASFADEQRRLRAELAALSPVQAPQQATAARTVWPFALVVLLLVPGAAVLLYVYLQGPFWQALDANRGEAAAPVDPAAMVARLQARLATNGNDAEGWKRLGRSYVVLGRGADARRAYGRAAELAPEDITVLEGYADAREPGSEPPAGIVAMIERLERDVVANSGDPRAWVRAGFARSLMNNLTGARDAYARAHTLDPQRPEVLAAYAGSEYALNPQQPSPQAVDLYRQLLALQPDNGSALWVLGQAAALAGQPAQAREHWQRLLGLLPPPSPMRVEVQRAIDSTSRAP